MYAKIPAGNQYDIIFPIAKWVLKLRARGQGPLHRPRRAHQRRAGLLLGLLLQRPVVDPEVTRLGAVHRLQDRIGWRTDKVDAMTGSWNDLWNPQAAKHIFTLDDQDEALAMAALLLGYDVNTAKPSHLEEMKKLLISQKKFLRAYSSDDVNNMAGGDAWIHHMWSGDFVYLRNGLVEKPENYDFEAPEEGTPINSDAYCIPTNAKHPGTAMLFIDYLLRPEVAIKNTAYLYYPFPLRDALPEFDGTGQGHPGLQRRRQGPREPRRVPPPRGRRGPAARGRLDRSEGGLRGDRRVDPPGDATAPCVGVPASAPGCGALLLALPTAWIVTFFVSSMVIVVLLSFRAPRPRRLPSSAPRCAVYARYCTVERVDRSFLDRVCRGGRQRSFLLVTCSRNKPYGCHQQRATAMVAICLPWTR